MRSWYLHITRVFILVIVTSTASLAQVLDEDYNNGSINQREDDCWQFDNFEINNTNPINNTGSDKKHGSTVNMDSYNFFSLSTWASSSSMSTPFVYFDGTGVVSFKHKADDDNYSTLSGGYLTLSLLDANGNQVSSVFTHVYRQPGWTASSQYPDGQPDIVHSESIPVTWTGFYRLQWAWYDYGDAQTEYYIDDIEIDHDTSSFEESTIVCLNETVYHTPTGANNDGAPNNFMYSWSWVGTSGGTIKSQATNDKEVSVDWNVGAGTYRLKVEETYGSASCNGRTFYINVEVQNQPTFILSISTVCQGERPVMNFDATVGKAPFTVTYDDGTGSQVFVTTGRDVVTLNANAIEVEILDVVDDNGCHADSKVLTTYPILYHPKPSTDPIYHY